MKLINIMNYYTIVQTFDQIKFEFSTSFISPK